MAGSLNCAAVYARMPVHSRQADAQNEHLDTLRRIPVAANDQ
jgi:hypothetical protein